MSAGMNVNQISSSSKWLNVDTASLSQVTSEILGRAQGKTSTLSQVDLSKFTRAGQGIDLYNSRTSVELQKQIASNNSSLNAVNVNTNYLNAQAASALYIPSNVAKNVEGKMTIGITEGDKETTREIYPLPKSTEVFSTAELSKDKRGSNPFATYTSVQNEDNSETLDILG